MSASTIARAMGVSCVAVCGWVKKAREAMAIMDTEREKRNPSAADVPHSVKTIRGMDAERPKAKAVSFDEMMSLVGFRKGEKRRAARILTATV